MKKILFIALSAGICLGGVACQKKPEPLKPGELKPEEKVRLKASAIKAYETILKDYPDSPHADEAKKRLQAIKPAGK